MSIFLFIGKLFNQFTLVFLSTWVLIPLLLVLLSKIKLPKWFKYSIIQKVRTISLVVSILFGFYLFSNFNSIRDQIGHKFIEGYSSYYYPDVDEYGRESQSIDISTSHWYSRVLLWLGEWGYLAFCVLIPYLTWKCGSMLMSSLEKLEQNKV
jgi:hypothetical protein